MIGVPRVVDPGGLDQLAKGHCALAVMTKAPRAGRVKTRLSPPLTPTEAAALNRCFLSDTAASISLTVEQGIARGIAVYTPVGAESDYRGILPADFQLLPQRGEKLEERLIFATEDLFRMGFASLCFIGSDSPTVPSQSFSRAVEILSQPGDTVVLGPTEDGGYYLIGLKKPHRPLFEDIDWSTDRVFEQTMARAEKMKIKVHLLPTWYDVDDHVTLQRLCSDFFGSNKDRAVGYPAPASRGFLEKLLAREGSDRIWPNRAKSDPTRPIG